MDITLGPWTSDKTIEEKQRKALTEAMADEAWNVVKKSPDFTPLKATEEKTVGFAIFGRITTVAKTAAGVEVAAQFNVSVDGRLSNVVSLMGRASASGGRMGAEDALRAVTEGRVKTILGAIKAGRVVRQG